MSIETLAAQEESGRKNIICNFMTRCSNRAHQKKNGQRTGHGWRVAVPMNSVQRGFSFIELLFCTLIITTVAMIGLPNIKRMSEIYQLLSTSNDIQSRLHYARIQAISQNTDQRLRVANPTTYVLEHRNGASWVVDQTFSLKNGYSVSATGTAEFHFRGNANPVATFTVINPKTEFRQVAVDTSGYIHVQ
jgi:prepilin-type N-terminal cleavage/methylation domain-containing protein